MLVSELINLLQGINPNAKVSASDTYGEGTFPITGILYNYDEVELTSENTD